jgi:hypothetical protein
MKIDTLELQIFGTEASTGGGVKGTRSHEYVTETLYLYSTHYLRYKKSIIVEICLTEAEIMRIKV